MKDHSDTIAHECGHAIGLLVEGHRVAEVRVDNERLGELGRTTVDYSQSSADYGMLVAGLMGPLAAGDAPPSWPFDPDSADTDERNIARRSTSASTTRAAT